MRILTVASMTLLFCHFAFAESASSKISAKVYNAVFIFTHLRNETAAQVQCGVVAGSQQCSFLTSSGLSCTSIYQVYNEVGTFVQCKDATGAIYQSDNPFRSGKLHRYHAPDISWTYETGRDSSVTHWPN